MLSSPMPPAPARPDDSPSPDFREQFLAAYAKRRKALRAMVRASFLETPRPAEELSMDFHTAGGCILGLRVRRDGELYFSIRRARKPNRGRTFAQYWGIADDPAIAFQVVERMIYESRGQHGERLADETRQNLLAIWTASLRDVETRVP